MATWGSQTWGYYNWGTLGDISITVSGQSTLSLSVGSVDQQSNPGWEPNIGERANGETYLHLK
jgi:hypothetical protein